MYGSYQLGNLVYSLQDFCQLFYLLFINDTSIHEGITLVKWKGLWLTLNSQQSDNSIMLNGPWM